ncbi:hypothetical protein BRO19_21945, partial [Xanthomonas oryzae pv. oryzae]
MGVQPPGRCSASLRAPTGLARPCALDPDQVGANEAAHHAGDKREPSQQQHEPPRLALKRRIRGDE